MKKSICIIIVLIIFVFSGCNRVTGYIDDPTDYVTAMYCGYVPSVNSEGKKLVDDTDIVIVPCGETVKDFYDKLSGLAEIEIFDLHGNIPDENTELATGFLVNRGESRKYYVVVLGDIDSDGKITQNDSVLAENYFMGTEKADALHYVIAADVNLSGNVDKTDSDLIGYASASENMALGWYYEVKAVSMQSVPDYEEYSKLINR